MVTVLIYPYGPKLSTMKSKYTQVTPDDYDAAGRLHLPVLFWGVLLLQARTWVLFIMAGASRQQGDTLLTLFYPDHQAFWGGLLMGLPALAGFFLCAWRQHFLRLWHHAYWVLLVAQVIIMCQTARHFFQDDASSLVSLLFCVADSVAFFWWVTNPRLRRCFFAPME